MFKRNCSDLIINFNAKVPGTLRGFALGIFLYPGEHCGFLQDVLIGGCVRTLFSDICGE